VVDECAPASHGKQCVEHLTIQRMEHVGIVVDDLAAATEFFAELGLVLQGEGAVEGRWVDRIVGLEGVRTEFAMMQTSDGNGRLELVKFHSPSSQGDNRHAPANVSATSHSPSRTSTPSSPACEPAALNSSASWSATRTSTGSATSAARRGSLLSWRSRSANAL
jgi:catechol 2,3-dioxygenase-like lactoylglutathione lyase family enzyme